MVTLIINKRKERLPAGKHEMTLNQYQRIVAEVDFNQLEVDWIKIFNILIKGNYKIEDVEIITQILPKIAWALVPITFDDFIPPIITIYGKEVNVPKNIGILPIGQAIYLKQAIHNIKYTDAAISKAAAVYLQRELDGKFSSDRIKEVEKELLEMPAYLFVSMGNFILGQLPTNGELSMNPRKAILTNLENKLRSLLPIWQTVVVLPAMGIWHLLYVTLNCFRSILIMYLRNVALIPSALFSLIKKNLVNTKKDMTSSIMN